MDDTSGFYKKSGDQLLYAPNFVIHAEYELYRAQKDTYSYPFNGWQWFDNQEVALVEFGLNPPEDVENGSN